MSDDDVRDELPEELDVTGYVGPYTFPDVSRRRIAGALCLLTALVLGVLYAAHGEAVLVNRGFAVMAAALALIGIYHLVAGWPLRVRETDALVEATRQVGFPVGHASAQLGWRGLLSRPTWRILLYSAENPPAKRGLVLVDGLDGAVLGHYVEDNPEDWSQYDG
jgi:hypothetical protein